MNNKIREKAKLIEEAIQHLENFMEHRGDEYEYEYGGFKWITNGLFYETAGKGERAIQRTDERCLFTTRDTHKIDNGRVWLSFKRLAVDLMDPTMYIFTTKYLGGLGHWKALQACKNTDIQRMLKETHEEIELAKYALGVEGVIQSVEEGNFQACKYIVERREAIKKKGRPTKEEAALKGKQDAMFTDKTEDYGESLEALERADLN